MRNALGLAERGLGRVAPNPAVGCVIVSEGHVIARGWTQPGGRPHAETEALAAAGQGARGATAYVTLEPCAHQGRTPPCVDAILSSGISRCVIALEDPDPRVNGRGIDRLRAAGITVETGLCRGDAAELNAGFLSRLQRGRPQVTLKLATTLDGRIATRGGESQWITGAPARARAHLLRARHDAILVGSGTAVADNPRLDVRLPGLEDRKPIRILVDGRLRLPLTHDLVMRAKEIPTWLITRTRGDARRLDAYRAAGLKVIEVGIDDSKRLILSEALKELGNRGVTRLLVEGGGHIAAGLLKSSLVDRVAWFRSPKVIGGDGISAAAGFGLESLEDCPRFVLDAVGQLGEDVLESYRRAT
jgi:diaminohydroxyphosphoribosylaminopyrimidine deaminase/5-amino-6-(5-phosphoribosylamino)uracil reductase